ncbi:T9SS type A sorting domain-containing protein [bacterium]|nr:T9SS type A sorting domain-containing protein [bacterium]
MRTFGTLTIFMMIVCSNSFAQPDSLWSRTFGGSSQDGASYVEQTDDGGFVLAGHTWSHSVGGALDFWLVKTDVNGDSMWSQAYGDSVDEICMTAQQTSDGGYILAGMKESISNVEDDFWLVKTNMNGDTLWTRSCGGVDREECYGVVETNDGGFAVAGFTESFGAGNEDIWLLKVSSSGDSLWSRTFGGALNDRCYALIQTSDGGLVLAGITRSFSTNSSDFWLVKTNASGDSLWSHSYGGFGQQECWTVAQTSDGGFVLAGWNYPTDNHDFYLVKTNSNGDSLWSHSYGGSNRDDCYSVLETASGGYALAGITMSYGAGSRDIWLLSVDSSGDSLWSRTFGGGDQEYGRCLRQTSDFGFVIGGSTYSFGAGSEDIWLVKTNAEPLPPQPFIRVIPVDSSFVNWPLDTFAWTRSLDPNGDEITYLFHLESNMPGYESFDVSTPDTILMFDRATLSGTLDEVFTFHWTVHAAANGDTVEASNAEGIYFYDTPEPPGPFNRILPEDSTTLTGSFIDFAWTTSIDPNGDEVTYLLSIHAPTYPIPDPYELTTTDTTITVPIAWDGGNLDEIHNFYWTVYATSNFDTVEAANGQGLFFVETPGPPGEFWRLLPPDCNLETDPMVEFAWSPSVDPNGDEVIYLLHVQSPTYPFPDPADYSTMDTSITIEIPWPVEPLDDVHEFYWTVHAAANFDTVEASNGEGVFYMDIPGCADASSVLPTEYSLSVYPNPFNPSTTISFSLVKTQDIELSIFNLNGRLLRTVVSGEYAGGIHVVALDASDLPTGTLFVILSGESVSLTRRVFVLR